MSKADTDPLTIAVWVAMADHFSDSETRHDLPLTALSCVEAGLSPAQAREVWQHEVSPAVGFNPFRVAGEWASWDRDWLVARIERVRVAFWHRPGRWRRVRLPMPLMGGQWLAIERSIELLQAVPTAAERQRSARDFARLARHLFDFCPENLATLPDEERQRLAQLYPAPFDFLMASALQRSERADAERRIQRALAGIAR